METILQRKLLNFSLSQIRSFVPNSPSDTGLESLARELNQILSEMLYSKGHVHKGFEKLTHAFEKYTILYVTTIFLKDAYKDGFLKNENPYEIALSAFYDIKSSSHEKGSKFDFANKLLYDIDFVEKNAWGKLTSENKKEVQSVIANAIQIAVWLANPENQQINFNSNNKDELFELLRRMQEGAKDKNIIIKDEKSKNERLEWEKNKRILSEVRDSLLIRTFVAYYKLQKAKGKDLKSKDSFEITKQLDVVFARMKDLISEALESSRREDHLAQYIYTVALTILDNTEITESGGVLFKQGQAVETILTNKASFGGAIGFFLHFVIGSGFGYRTNYLNYSNSYGEKEKLYPYLMPFVAPTSPEYSYLDYEFQKYRTLESGGYYGESRSFPLVNEQIGFGYRRNLGNTDDYAFKVGLYGSGLIYKTAIRTQESKGLIYGVFTAFDFSKSFQINLSYYRNSLPNERIDYTYLGIPLTGNANRSDEGITLGVNIPIDEYIKEL